MGSVQGRHAWNCTTPIHWKGCCKFHCKLPKLGYINWMSKSPGIRISTVLLTRLATMTIFLWRKHSACSTWSTKYTCYQGYSWGGGGSKKSRWCLQPCTQRPTPFLHDLELISWLFWFPPCWFLLFCWYFSLKQEIHNRDTFKTILAWLWGF